MSRAVLLALLAPLAGCVDLLVGGPPPECVQTTDCNAPAGEVCDQGVCWGDPPTVQIAVVIGPPADRPDLVATELPAVSIGADGWMEPVAAAWPQLLHGRIEASCDGCRLGAAIAATITVRRPSLIPGAHGFEVTTASTADASGADSFGVLVPTPGPDDPPYRATITPDDTTPLFPDGPTAAEVVPPLQRTLTADDLASGLCVVLAADQLRTVRGVVVDARGHGVSDYRVHAEGRTDPSQPIDRVSTFATTDSTGAFALLLGSGTLDVIDVIAEPKSGEIAPTLARRDFYLQPTGTTTVALTAPDLPSSLEVSLPVVYTDTNGVDAAVSRARVELSTTVPAGDTVATFVATGQTDDTGHYVGDVLGGAREYTARITPPPDAITASTLALIDVDGDGGLLPAVRLGQRSTITGVIADAAGEPAGGLALTAAPSTAFLWSLDDETQALLAARARPTAATNPDGTFTIWLDPSVSAIAATYDLDVEPGDFAAVPRATIAGIDGSASANLGWVYLPEAAHVRGVVTDPDGNALPDAQLKVYEIVPAASSCIAQNAPPDCQLPAVVLGTGIADLNGVARLTLPR